MAKASKIETAAKRAHAAYLEARSQFLATREDADSGAKGSELSAQALPGLRSSAVAAWDRLVSAASVLTDAQRAAYAWALDAPDYAIGRIA